MARPEERLAAERLQKLRQGNWFGLHEEAADLFATLDANQDGVVSREELFKHIK